MRHLACLFALFLAACSGKSPTAPHAYAPPKPAADIPLSTPIKDNLGQPDLWARHASPGPGGHGYTIGGFLPSGPPPQQGEAVIVFWLDRTKAQACDGMARLVFVKDGLVTRVVEDNLVVGW